MAPPSQLSDVQMLCVSEGGLERNRVSTMEGCTGSSGTTKGVYITEGDLLFVVEGAPRALGGVGQQLERGAEPGTCLLAHEHGSV